MAKEGATRQEIIKALCLSGFHAMAVDNEVAHPGTPDIEWCHVLAQGWIEVKRLPYWPKRGGLVLVPKFTMKQRLWLAKRAATGGNAHFVLHVGHDRCLLPGGWAAAHIASSSTYRSIDLRTHQEVPPATQQSIRAASIIIWTGPAECKNLLPQALLPK